MDNDWMKKVAPADFIVKEDMPIYTKQFYEPISSVGANPLPSSGKGCTKKIVNKPKKKDALHHEKRKKCHRKDSSSSQESSSSCSSSSEESSSSSSSCTSSSSSSSSQCSDSNCSKCDDSSYTRCNKKDCKKCDDSYSSSSYTGSVCKSGCGRRDTGRLEEEFVRCGGPPVNIVEEITVCSGTSATSSSACSSNSKTCSPSSSMKSSKPICRPKTKKCKTVNNRNFRVWANPLTPICTENARNDGSFLLQVRSDGSVMTIMWERFSGRLGVNGIRVITIGVCFGPLPSFALDFPVLIEYNGAVMTGIFTIDPRGDDIFQIKLPPAITKTMANDYIVVYASTIHWIC